MHRYLLTAVVLVTPLGLARADDSAPNAATGQAKSGSQKADAVVRWNDLTLDAIRQEQTAPPMAARNLAMVHVAIYDAVNSIDGKHSRYLVKVRPLPGASAEAAAVGAAHRVLVDLYPRQRGTFDEALAEALAAIPEGNGKLAGKDLGRFVGERVLAWRSRDGVDRQVNYAPEAAPGVWQRTPPDYAEPVLPHWPQLKPFAMDERDRPHPKELPRLTDTAYTKAFNEVKELGAADSKTRTKDQTEIARFWADGAGTCTPPGHWNQIAQSVAQKRGTTLAENARLFALLNIALADAGILCWDCKYKLSFWRPVTGIREADRASNPDTAPDREWTPLLTTPPFPSYVSGHSSFSGAAATVLTDVFGDKVRFQTTSEGLPGATRKFDSFWAAAEEAGQSRIYGGIHWQFDNTEGLAIGKNLAQYVGRSYLVAVDR